MTDLSHLSEETREKVEAWDVHADSAIDPELSMPQILQLNGAFANAMRDALLAEVERWKWVATHDYSYHEEDPEESVLFHRDGERIAALLSRYDAEVKP